MPGAKRGRTERDVKAGTGTVSARPLRDSSELLRQGEYPALRSRLDQDGYVYLRGLIPRQNVVQVQSIPVLSTQQ